jgi:hypothetical protein
VDRSAINGAKVGDLFSTALGHPRLSNGGFELWVTGPQARVAAGRPAR